MGVRVQYPSTSVLLLTLDLDELERKKKNHPMEYGLRTQLPPTDFFDQRSSSPLFPPPSGGNNSANARKRGRESNPTPTSAVQQQHQSPINLFSLQPQQHQISSAVASPIHSQWQKKQRQQQQQPNSNSWVSTGLRLSFSDKCNQQNKHQQFDCNLDFSPQIDLHKNEMDRLLHAQMEQLRHKLGDMRRKHYRALLFAAEKSATKGMQGKATELEFATRRNAELEETLTRLKAESAALQAKARADEMAAEALQKQLRHAAAAVVEDPGVSDCESACVDPRREERERERERKKEGRFCRWCWSAEADVVLLPCRHLCVCRSCDAAASGRVVCPVCSCVKSASVEVYLS